MAYSAAQNKSKQRFWRKLKAQGLNSDPAKLTNVQIARLVGEPAMVTYLSDPEFAEWFLNEKHEEDLLKSGAESAIRCLMGIIEGSIEVKSAAVQVQAAKILLDMAGFSPKITKETVFKDEHIGKMSEDELKDYIQKQTEQVN